MILLGSYLNSQTLWFSAAAAQGSNLPGEQSNEPNLEMRSLRILIVEDEFFISLHIKELVQTLGHVVVAIAVSADQAVKSAEVEHPDVVLMDIRLVGSRDGIDAAEEIRRRFGIGSVFVTANTDSHTRKRAQAVQPLGFLAKPVSEHGLKLALSGVAPR